MTCPETDVTDTLHCCPEMVMLQSKMWLYGERPLRCLVEIELARTFSRPQQTLLLLARATVSMMPRAMDGFSATTSTRSGIWRAILRK